MNLFRKDAMSSKKEKDKVIQYEDPPDGGWGWLVVLHCFLVCAHIPFLSGLNLCYMMMLRHFKTRNITDPFSI